MDQADLNLTLLSLFAGILLSITVGATDTVETSSSSKAPGIGQKRSVWDEFQAFGKTAPFGILYFVPREPGLYRRTYLEISYY